MAKEKQPVEHVHIKRANLRILEIPIVGDGPLVIHAWGAKALRQLRETQERGSTQSSSRRKKEPKDFIGAFNDARHISTKGWDGFHAGAIRNAAIAACRLLDYTMVKAKMSIFILPDGFTKDGTPLIRIQGAEAKPHEGIVRVANGQPDIRVRPMYFPWSANIRVQYDADQFTAEDVINLIDRCGRQVGLCEGRALSPKSAGMGWGMFHVPLTEEEQKSA